MALEVEKMRHGKYEPGPIPTFWKSEMALGKITELEYYKHIYPRTIIKGFLKTINSIMERIEFHTENPDSELMDEISEVYKEYKERIK